MTLLLDDLRHALASEQAVVVAGAGVAIAASGGAPLAGWRGLLEDGIARVVELGRVPEAWSRVQHDQLDLGDVESWLAVAEQVTNRLGGRSGGEFRRWLRETVGSLEPDPGGARVVQPLVELGVPLCTTNYDGLLEELGGLDAVSWRDGPRAQRVLRGDEPGIVHLHGFWREPESVILGVRSYEALLRDGSAQAMLRALASMRSLVLVGFGAGLGDPNFGAFRAWMAETLAGSEYRHFRLVREEERDAALAEHDPAERVEPVVYGRDHADLGPFLRELSRAASTRVRGRDKKAAAAPATLPAPRPFFGRDELVEALVAAVLDVEAAPVPVLGPPGIGKSALVQACAHDPRVAKRFGSRRVWVRCDGSSTASALLADLAVALGIAGGDALEEAVLGELGREPTLLMLDNAETPWEGDLPATEELLARLAGVPGLALVCSIRGAQRPLGPRWADSLLVPPLLSAPAEQVFLAAAGDRFAGDPNLPALLGDLDGMPIAIELLGRLAQAEPDLDVVVRRWERRRTDLLSAGPDPDRHLSVAVSFDLSIDNPRLDASARRFLSVLAHLPDGVAVEELDAVFPDGEDAAGRLRTVGLVFDEGDRLRVLKPIRDHVAAHRPPTADDARRAAEHWLALARRLGPAVGAEQGASAAATLSAESANLTWAITVAIDGVAPNEGIDSALALADFGRFTGVPIGHLVSHAAERARDLGDDRRLAQALFALGLLATDPASAREQIEQALPVFRRLGEVLGEAHCIHRLGHVALECSDYDLAGERFEEALALYRQVGDALGEASCIKTLGNLALERFDHDGARDRYEQALPLFRRIGDVLGEANCIQSLGVLALESLDLAAAQERFERALPLYRDAATVLGEANCLEGLGRVALCHEDHDAARQRFEQALPLYRRVGSALGEAHCVVDLGEIARLEGDHEAARERFEAALRLYESIPEPLSIGQTHLRLANLASGDARGQRLEAARAAWRGIGRDDLVARLSGL